MENDPNKKDAKKNESKGKRLLKRAIRRSSKASNDSQNSSIVGVSRSKSCENNESIEINDSTPLPKADGTKDSIEKAGKSKKDGKIARPSQKASSSVDKVGKTEDLQENRNKIFSKPPSPSKKSSKLISSKLVIKDTIPEEDGLKKNLKRKLDEETRAGTSGASTSADPDADDPNKVKKKKNRCAVCGKKVGLTGFECRCGGLFCAVHRYSDKHDCTFDYKELGAQEIRRNNPVVVSQKIDKI